MVTIMEGILFQRHFPYRINIHSTLPHKKNWKLCGADDAQRPF
jgi:hypothetical protein